jgi:ribulose-5-phosphate 4-epimerase/fuculose-1-phosphate aldolase
VTETTVQTGKSGISAEERELRVELAAAHRLAEKYGMSEIINTHISLRLPDSEPCFLIKPQGLLFDEITASNLLKIRYDGSVIGDSPYKPNRAGVAIHGSILDARPDINCVVHTHTPYGTAVSLLECGLLPASQAALRFTARIAYHDYGRATDPVECSRLAEDMGDKSVMILRNHGLIATGRTVGEAFTSAFYLEKACQFQVLAQSTGQPLELPSEEILRESEERAAPGTEELAWPALLRMLDRQDPSYRY